MVCLIMSRAACLIALLVRVQGQVRVMAPQALVQEFAKSRGLIEGSTATFGAPFYGDRVLGRLVYGDSSLGQKHCSDEDYSVPKDQTSLSSTSAGKEVRLINIILVRRGGCSFTKKVKVASAKGAHAVIIVDKEDSVLTSKDMHNIIVADDGTGENIEIPSVLISKDDGGPLIQAAKRYEVIVELAWNLPTNHTVQTDLWMSSASRESFKFLKEFAPKRRILNKVMAFTPHYAVFGMDQVDVTTASSLCSDATGKYCAEDPDGPGPITGRDVLAEDVRQLCIHDLYKKIVYADSVMDSAAAKIQEATRGIYEAMAKRPLVEYAAQFWAYMEKFPEACPLESFGLECSERLMLEVGIDAAKIEACAKSSGQEKLAHERKNPAWSPRALRINGWRYSGVMDADLVTRAICSGFVEQPQECKDLVKPRDPFTPFSATVKKVDGVSFGALIGWLIGAVLLVSAALLLYKRSLKKEIGATLREEVMLEVQAQIGEYSRLQGK